MKIANKNVGDEEDHEKSARSTVRLSIYFSYGRSGQLGTWSGRFLRNISQDIHRNMPLL